MPLVKPRVRLIQHDKGRERVLEARGCAPRQREQQRQRAHVPVSVGEAGERSAVAAGRGAAPPGDGELEGAVLPAPEAGLATVAPLPHLVIQNLSCELAVDLVHAPCQPSLCRHPCVTQSSTRVLLPRLAGSRQRWRGGPAAELPRGAALQQRRGAGTSGPRAQPQQRRWQRSQQLFGAVAAQQTELRQKHVAVFPTERNEDPGGVVLLGQLPLLEAVGTCPVRTLVTVSTFSSTDLPPQCHRTVVLALEVSSYTRGGAMWLPTSYKAA
mmetsp:Transcript_129574/g.361035  ORF Transcript_129574/g.361035 Transcript_129574/m.361035 type:complete len:269 (+) Transcript_129574:368-1174(+)